MLFQPTRYPLFVLFFRGGKNVWWWTTNIGIWFSLWYCLLNVCDVFPRVYAHSLAFHTLFAMRRENRSIIQKKIYKWVSFKANFYRWINHFYMCTIYISSTVFGFFSYYFTAHPLLHHFVKRLSSSFHPHFIATFLHAFAIVFEIRALSFFAHTFFLIPFSSHTISTGDTGVNTEHTLDTCVAGYRFHCGCNIFS